MRRRARAEPLGRPSDRHDAPTSTGRSSPTSIARSRRGCDAWCADAPALRAHDATPTSTRRAGASCARSARRAGCATACPRRTAARCRRSTRARCASRARRSPCHDGLADFAFAMQGLGSGADHAGGHATRSARAGCPRVARGEAIAAFALSEPDAGSDVGAMTTRARARRRRAGCSTAARRGSPTAASPTSTACLRARARRPARAGISRVPRAAPTRPGSRSPSAST